MVFVVDNGPAKQPSSHLVQMCLVRLLNFLQLDKLTQVSFAEYHSERNFVERVHAEENRVLSKHGPFDSKPLHKQATAGSKEHAENMESVAEEVRKCIVQGSFGGHPLQCYRGVKQSEYVFNDEKELQIIFRTRRANSTFTINLFCTGWEHYGCLALVWNLDPNFTGNI